MKTDVERLLEGHGISSDFKYQSFPQCSMEGKDPQLLTEIFARLANAPSRKSSGEQPLKDVFDQLAKKTT